MAELERRELRVRERLAQSVIHKRDADAVVSLTPADREWLQRELAEMQMILERYIAESPDVQRDLIRYQVALRLPQFHYLRDACEIFNSLPAPGC